MGRIGGTAGLTSTKRLFVVYAAVSLVPVLVLGALIAAYSSRQSNRAGIHEGVSEAQLVARTTVAPLLAGHDLRSGLQTRESRQLARTVKLAVHDGDVLRLRVRDLDGHVVFADDGAGIGSVDDEALDAAHGDVRARVTWLNSDSGDQGARGPRVVEAYVPLVSAQSGRRIGVLEVYLPYAPIAASINSGRHVLSGIIGVGLFVLWVALLAVSMSVTRRLRRHATDNAFLARHDALTQLPNRAAFVARAADAITDATPQRQVAIAVVDLDRFKEVNDTLGHGNGDELLVELAARLAVHTREDDVVARLGGDEFGLILNGLHGPAEALEILGRLRALLGETSIISGLPLTVEASIGFVVAPADADDSEQALARADIAMYVAKRDHRGVVHYQPSHDQYDAGHLTLIAELADAIASDQLVLHYQPKLDVRDGSVAAVEALVRWDHPVRGLLYPGAFLGAAEQTELVEPLTRWVLRTALRELPGLDPTGRVAVAVNISARSLVRSDFAADVLDILRECDADPSRVILEITETALVVDPEGAARTLCELHTAGVRVSIDDFGAGQTSLGYLARLPVSELKIDKAFVLAMSSDPRNAAIVRSVIELGHSLGFTVTAEGVETREVLDSLVAASCDVVQGFYFAKPMPPEQLVATFDQLGRDFDPVR